MHLRQVRTKRRRLTCVPVTQMRPTAMLRFTAMALASGLGS